MKTAVIMQPTYLPWLGYFDLMRKADIFVIYDHAQFSRQSWQQRNRIRSRDGEVLLTVPVLNESGQSIRDVRINPNHGFVKKHLDSIRFNYCKTKNFDGVFSRVEGIFGRRHSSLMDLNMDFIELARDILKIKTEMVFSSSLGVTGHKVDALVAMCQKLGADHYLSPVGAREYIEENNIFAANGINLSYQDFAHPTYQQANYKDFISHLAFLDFTFNDPGDDSSS